MAVTQKVMIPRGASILWRLRISSPNMTSMDFYSQLFVMSALFLVYKASPHLDCEHLHQQLSSLASRLLQATAALHTLHLAC